MSSFIVARYVCVISYRCILLFAMSLGGPSTEAEDAEDTTMADAGNSTKKPSAEESDAGIAAAPSTNGDVTA